MRALDHLIAAAYRRRVPGAGRVARVLYGEKFGRSVPCRLDGLRWDADPLDWMDQQILITGTYEPEIATQLVRLLRSGDVFWDVGANAGVHALRVKAAHPDVTVVAFEPSPRQYSRLRHNAAANHLEILAYCIALAGQRGYQPLSVVDLGNSGHNSLRPWDDVAYSGALPCWCDTVDDIVASGAATPNVMKVDVEGCEHEVFAGMVATLASSGLRCVIFESGDGAPELAAAGFSVERVEASGGGENWVAVRH